jgi:hypothetical protein
MFTGHEMSCVRFILSDSCRLRLSLKKEGGTERERGMRKSATGIDKEFS